MKFWKVKAKAEEDAGELVIYGDISGSKFWGDEVTATEIRNALNGLGDIKQLDIYINSGGGDVFVGNAIYNILKAHPAYKVAHIDGLAASAASIVAMAADKVVMPKNSLFMIHKPYAYVSGNTDELMKIIEVLERVENGFVDIYSSKTGLDEKEIREMMAAESWFSAEEAYKAKFADEIDEGVMVAACVSNGTLEINGLTAETGKYRNFPELKMKHVIPIEPVAPAKQPEPVAAVTAEEIKKFLEGVTL